MGALQAAVAEEEQERLIAGAHRRELEDARVADAQWNGVAVRLCSDAQKFRCSLAQLPSTLQ